MAAVTLGIERLLRSDRLRGTRIGLVANTASVDASFRHVADLVAGHSTSRLVALFGPQHGFQAEAQDNMVESPHGRDSRIGTPVYSLYSQIRKPTPEMLQDLDTLVIDLQDVGTRVYTFVYTMANCMRAAATHGIDVIVCDRPNPIGGADVEGPILQPACRSFVGQFSIPLRHGMTIGELAGLFNDAFGIGARLEVSRLEGWDRTMYQDDTGLPWIMPSPNVPTLDSAIVYPGAVLFEGTNLSEGRGTTRPFELIGAPWLDPHALVTSLENASPARDAHSTGLVRTDVPETRGHAVRRVPGSRDGPRDIPTCRDRHHLDGRDPRTVTVIVRVAPTPVRVRTREDADRYPVRLRPAPRAGRAGDPRIHDRCGLGRRPFGVHAAPRAPPPVLRAASRPTRQCWRASDILARPQAWPADAR